MSEGVLLSSSSIATVSMEVLPLFHLTLLLKIAQCACTEFLAGNSDPGLATSKRLHDPGLS